MSLIDAAGFLAGGFVILAFYCTRAIPLRGFAIASNLLFVLYGFERDLAPIAILHLVLLPLNVWRLREALSPVPQARRSPAPFLRSNATLSPFEHAMSGFITAK